MRAEKAGELTTPGTSRPWFTAAIVAVAMLAWISPGVRDWFLYDRMLITNGQAWRLWSGHLAHHGTGHLFWNLAVFAPVGVWLERAAPRTARWFLATAPLFISAVLMIFDSKLQYYAGLSGVTVGVLVLLALLQLRRGTGEPKWFWSTILVLVTIKTAAEFLHQDTAFFAGLPAGIRNVPLAHLAGALGALGMFAVISLTRKTSLSH